MHRIGMIEVQEDLCLIHILSPFFVTFFEMGFSATSRVMIPTAVP